MATFFRVFCRAEPLNDGTALRSQLIGKYAIAPKAAGFGISLILWFGLNKLSRATVEAKYRPARRSCGNVMKRIPIRKKESAFV